jgi:hypothetical protein
MHNLHPLLVRKGKARAYDKRILGNVRASELGAQDVRAISARDESGALVDYVADMTRQLEAMARAADLSLLAYLLAMARLEAEVIVLNSRMRRVDSAEAS